jgi:predicted phosphodiesterase
LCLLHLGSSCSSAPKTYPPWTYIVAADPQLYLKQQDDRYWRETVRQVNARRPEFLIICGDLIHGANDPKKWEDPKIMALHNKLADEYQGVARGLRVPVHNVAGNHDVSLSPTPQTLEWYTERFGAPWYSFVYRQSLFVVLESNLIRSDEGAPEAAKEQWTWFLDLLKQSSQQPYIHKTLYMHHPVCTQSIDEKDGYYNLPQDKRQELLSLLKAHGFKAVFCGHYHKNAYVRDGDLELITTSSCCVPQGKDPRGFRLVTVYPDRIAHEYIGF